MHPVCFSIFSFTVYNYFVFWMVSFCIFFFYTGYRAKNLFGIEPAEINRIIFWICIAAVISAYLGNISDKFFLKKYDEMFSGGMSSSPGILFGGITGAILLYRRKIPVDIFAEAATLPFALFISIGRIGCFLQGCCYGILVKGYPHPWWAVYFPFDAPYRVPRYPTQLMESGIALILFFVCLLIEKFSSKASLREGRRGFIFPLFLSGYALYRLFFDKLRAKDILSKYYCYLALIFAVIWIAVSFYKGRYKKSGACSCEK